ncbi:polysaccharide deacetylase family protein [candidate division KSB1 bacterium]|nr:polysaccharide deacetylase family protein [candidate division KSB1 bacterium]
MLANLKRQFQNLSRLFNGLTHNVYPDFVTRAVVPKQIPVFCFHRVLAAEFEQQLKYLHANGYQTVTGDAYFEAITTRNSNPARTVVLTFDDGLENFYEVAYPLLKKYHFTAIAFIFPRGVGQPAVINWEQAREMHQSGVIDFQSHSYSHAGIFTGPSVVDFFHPRFKVDRVWNLPVLTVNGKEQFFQLPAPGTPIFEYASRLSDQRRYFPPAALSDACQQLVQKCGGNQFFQQKNWAYQLKSHFEKIKTEGSDPGRFETEAEQYQHIQAEFVQSKQEIEAQLPRKIVRYLAFPWNQAGKVSRALLPQCGYRGAFGGLVSTAQAEKDGIDLFYLNRVSGDYILALPGRGRKSLASILYAKIKRQLRHGDMY